MTATLITLQYTDQTGYATHVHFELLEYFPRSTVSNLRHAAFTAPVRNGVAELHAPGALQVFELTAQAVISSSPSDVEPLGPPVTFRIGPNRVIRKANIVTIGELIPRTVVTNVSDAPLRQHTSASSETLAESETYIEQLEVSFEVFDYEDMEHKEAAAIEIVLTGLKNGVAGNWSPPLAIAGHTAGLQNNAPDNYSDITLVTLQAFQDQDKTLPYGGVAKKTADPNFYLTGIHGHTTGSPPNTWIEADQAQPYLFARSEDSDLVLPKGKGTTPRTPRASKNPTRSKATRP